MIAADQPSAQQVASTDPVPVISMEIHRCEEVSTGANSGTKPPAEAEPEPCRKRKLSAIEKGGEPRRV